MGAWNALLAAGFVLIFVGLFTHWSIIFLGALLPFVPVVVSLWRLRRTPPDRQRRPSSGDGQRG